MHVILIGGPMHGQARQIDDTWTRWDETGMAGDRHRYLRQSPLAASDAGAPVTQQHCWFAHESLDAQAARQAIADYEASPRPAPDSDSRAV